MTELNTTPLIDVMLVLLVMIIITVPPASHKVPMDLPRPVSLPMPINPVVNDLSIDAAGVTRWNGAAIGDGVLKAMLGAAATASPAPEIHFRPDPAARYERVDQVLAMARIEGVTKLGFVGNAQHARAF